MAHDREVAGIRCTEVLESLPDYLEDSLPAPDRSRVEAHLRGCTWCERFGGDYAGAVTALRTMLREPAPPGPATKLRLRNALTRRASNSP